jgi:predicted RNase H-like HicB family nuclease
MRRVKEAIGLCLEAEREAGSSPEFIGVQRIRI